MISSSTAYTANSLTPTTKPVSPQFGMAKITGILTQVAGAKSLALPEVGATVVSDAVEMVRRASGGRVRTLATSPKKDAVYKLTVWQTLNPLTWLNRKQVATAIAAGRPVRLQSVRGSEWNQVTVETGKPTRRGTMFPKIDTTV
ncbi:MAG: hypothetical protein VKJ04_07745 [Vampirovibrionales bacterium]|nr:hypothetical protein [Vampirovibrionales bacterium]